MKILVTGGAGYIGSVLVPELLRNKHQVVVLDNFFYNQTSLLEHCVNDNLTVVRGDARDEKLLEKLLEGVDIVIPLACLVGAPLCDKFPREAKSVNLGAIRSLLKIKKRGQKIIFPNTNSGYGIGIKDAFCTEESPLKPISLYGKVKVQAEKEILESGNSIVFRLATVFGASPRMRLDLLVNDFVYRAVNDRTVVLFEAAFKRNYIHIRDVARAFVFAIDNFDKMKGNAYNLGLSNANLNKRELCEEIKKQLPSFYFLESEIGKDPDKRDYIVSNEKIEKQGFKPRYSLNDGIKELIKAFQVVKRNQYANI